MLLIMRVNLKEHTCTGNEMLDSVNLMGIFCLGESSGRISTDLSCAEILSVLWSPMAQGIRESLCPEESFMRKCIFWLTLNRSG